MVKICHNCHHDHEEANLKRCAGCRQGYYCSTACQKENWFEHIFDCKPRRPINTADYLARAGYQNQFPEHSQTCEDYRFNRAFTPEEKSNLLDLYIELIDCQEIPPKTIHGWRVRGVLVDEIKVAFYKIPERARGSCFSWFLRNEHVIAQAGQPLPEETLDDNLDIAMVRAWRFIGGSERDSPEEIAAAIARKHDDEVLCHCLYNLLLSKQYPPQASDLWIGFGFASCKSQEERTELCTQYLQLISQCSFREFYDSYHTCRLFDLFDSKGLQVDHREHLRDLLHSPPGCKKSVWYLKQCTVQEDTIKEESNIPHSVMVEYGFINCKNDSERRQLQRVYKAFFDKHDGDPLALHEAAMKGNIHGYLSTVVQRLRDPKFRRLMRNPYHL